VHPEILLISLDALEVMTVSYESLFDKGPDSPISYICVARIAKFQGVDAEGLDLIPPTKRMSPITYRDELDSFSELRQEPRGTEYRERLLEL